MNLPRAVAVVDGAAIASNCRLLGGGLRPNTELCAVVKADGYGHGAPPGAALRGGARRIAVSTAAEAVEIRARFPSIPLLALGALTLAELDDVIAAEVELGAEQQMPVALDVLARRQRLLEGQLLGHLSPPPLIGGAE